VISLATNTFLLDGSVANVVVPPGGHGLVRKNNATHHVRIQQHQQHGGGELTQHGGGDPTWWTPLHLELVLNFADPA